MQWTCLAVFVAFAAASTSGDECAPPKPGDKTPPFHECCKREKKLPSVMKENIPACVAKFPVTAKMDFEDALNAMVCTSECVFEESKLFTPEGKLDIPAIKKVMIATYPEKINMSADIDKCYAKISSQVDSSGECKSGAYELEDCLRRNCFLNCPKSLWTASKECEDLRKKVEMCPEFPMVDMKTPK